MKKILLFLCIAATVFTCGNEEPKKKSSRPKKVAVKKADGEKVYKTYCVTCHGIKGNMGASGAFNLQTSELKVDERIAVITYGRNTMTPFKDLLSEEKIKAVAKYTMKLKKK